MAARGLFLATLCALAGGMLLTSASALAAPPTPSVVVSEVTATSATFDGTLTPAEVGATYEFNYGKAGVPCVSEKQAPQGSEGVSIGEEALPAEHVTNLAPGTEYMVCLHVWNAAHTEETESFPAARFTTVPAPTTTIPSPIAARTATLTGHFTLNATATQYFFRYEAGTECAPTEGSPHTTPVEAGTGTGNEVATTAVTELSPNTQYTVCLVTSNAYGSAQGPPVTFTTAASGPVIAAQYATDVTPLSATLNAEIDPGGADTSYSFEYGETSSYDTKIPLSGAALGSVTYGRASLVAGSPQLRAVPAAGPFSVGQLIGGRGIVPGTEITAAAAPHGGVEELTLSIPVAERSEDVALFAVSPASEQLQGLHPNTIYHYRVVATNEVGGKVETVDGPDAMFTTVVASNGLPDDRVAEMVTPLDNDNADVYAPGLMPFTGTAVVTGTGALFQAADNGEAVTYVSEPVSGGTGSSGDSSGGGSSAGGHTGTQLLAKRAAGGWVQEVISPSGANHSYYEAFSSELSVGVLLAGNGFGETTPLLPEAEALTGGYHVLYERDLADRGLRALFTGFTQPSPPGVYGFHPLFVGGSSDFSTLVFDANGALAPGAPAGSDVYASDGGRLSLVNVLPDGSIEPEAQAGGPEEADTSEEGSPEFSHAVSTDGARVFWTGLGAHPGLYMRENAVQAQSPLGPNGECTVVEDACTVQLDASQAGGPGGGGHFWTASANGERAFFTDDAAVDLTHDTVPGSGLNLYEYDVANGVLTDLTAASDARVQGVLGTSEDGSYVYFVADGALLAGAPTGDCVELETARAQEESVDYAERCDLYVRHDGVTRFIAPLTFGDGLGSPNFAGFHTRGDWVTGQGQRSVEVSPSGSLLFESHLSLTGYPNQGLAELYLYEPVGGKGELTCVSCAPSGSPPEDERFGQEAPAGLPISRNPAAATRLISADGGRVFFDSPVALVSQDTNGQVDVYEWERPARPGETNNTCTAEDASPVTGGCTYLLTGGKSNDGSFVLAASADGDDVFVMTRAQLVESDRNENFDAYDVRVDGVRAVSPSLCSGTGCQGVPPSPPVFATPSSVTFEGVGNVSSSTTVKKPSSRVLTNAQKLAAALRACSKKPKPKRANCAKQARKRYAVKSKVKKPSNHRRAK